LAGTPDRVTFTGGAAERIAKAVRKVEQGDRDCGPLAFDRVGNAVAPVALRVATFTGNWETGTYKTVTLQGSTHTASVYNWVNPVIGGDTASSTQSRYVIFGKAGGRNSAVELPIGGLRIGKTSGAWTKGTLASIELWEGGTPQNPAAGGGTINNVANLWGDVAANKWVGITHAHRGSYYLVVAEC
jgi:hypothetical protein